MDVAVEYRVSSGIRIGGPLPNANANTNATIDGNTPESIIPVCRSGQRVLKVRPRPDAVHVAYRLLRIPRNTQPHEVPHSLRQTVVVHVDDSHRIFSIPQEIPPMVDLLRVSLEMQDVLETDLRAAVIQ